MDNTPVHAVQLGELKGHKGHVTSIAVSPQDATVILSSSRDKTVMVWKLEPTNPVEIGKALRSLHGHNHYVQDVVISHDGQFALSGSWDTTLRLWDITQGVSTRLFKGHTQDVTSVAFSGDNRQIISGSRDNTIKVWNTIGECKFTLEDNRHTEWVSCVRFSPNTPTIVSGSWDKSVKIWDIKTFKCINTLVEHTEYINTVTISPDGSLCASGGKDHQACLWELSSGKPLYKLDAKSVINSLAFSPNKYWLCAATQDRIIVWDLLTKQEILTIIPEIKVVTQVQPAQNQNKKKKEPKVKIPSCLSLAWSADGQTLYAGYTDNIIRAYKIATSQPL